MREADGANAGKVPSRKPKRCQYRSPLPRHWPINAIRVQDCQSLHGTHLRRTGLQDGWCGLHKPEISSHDDEDFADFFDLLTDYVEASLESDNIIELSGLRWLFPRDVTVEKDFIFGQTEEDLVARKCVRICLHDSKYTQDLKIRSLCAPKIELDLSFSEIQGSLIIDGVNLDHLDLSNARIHGDLEIRNVRIARGVSLRDIEVLGSLTIESDSQFGPEVSFSGASVRKTFRISNSEFGRVEDHVELNQPLLRSRQSRTQLDDAFDQVATKFGAFSLKNVTFHNRCEFGRVDIERYLDFADVKFLGGLSFDRASTINDSIIRDLTIAVPQQPNNRELAETRRAIRAFREIARASGNTVASSRLIREERQILAKQGEATKLQTSLWRLHDFVSESNLSWELPAWFLVGQAFLFASLISLDGPPTIDWLVKSSALSLANTFAPFVSLQVSILVDDVSTLMLSTIQSAIAAGLISSLIMSIRETFE